MHTLAVKEWGFKLRSEEIKHTRYIVFKLPVIIN